MIQCSQCHKTNSPSHARFCVDCGYALRQACPYGCGFMALAVEAQAPAPQCPKCARFLAVCPHCLRLLPLGARACPTPRCARDGVTPREPLAWHDGRAGGAPVALRADWHAGKPALLDPKAHSPAAAQRCGALAARYGKVVWWKESKLHLWDAPTPGGFWPPGNPQTVEAIAPLFGGGIFPHREALLLAHGCAYLLGKNAAAKIALGQENATRQLLSLREVGDVAAPAAWQPHHIEWMAQVATDNSWLALGSAGDELVGLRAPGSSPLFEAQRWALPPGVDLNDWQELLAWNDAPLLRCERVIWHEQSGAWSQIFELASGETSLDGALVCGPHLWIWGQEAGRLWVERLSAGQTRDASVRARPSLPFAPGDSVATTPTVWGNRITFFVAGSRQGAATLDVARSLDETEFQQLPAASQVLWTASAAHDQNQWLLYALDDGELVRFFGMQQTPVASQPLQLMQFRPFRDDFLTARGATLAATISGDCLVISYIGTVRGQDGVWLMAHAWR